MPTNVQARRRNIPFGGYAGRVSQTYPWVPRTDVTKGGFNPCSKWQGTQYTESENHPGWRSRKEGVLQGDLGGNFLTQKTYVEPGEPAMYDLRGTESFEPPTGRISTINYHGPCFSVTPSQVSFPPYHNSSKSTIDAWGTSAIAKCKPNLPTASALQAAVEIYHEGLPKLFGISLWKNKTKVARGAGEEYLNYQFGWLPVASDIASFAAGVVNLDRTLDQYERDSGKVVRRRFAFPPIVTHEYTEYLSAASASIDPYIAGIYKQSLTGKGKVYKHRYKITERWFSGAFTYYLPADYDSRKGIKHHASLARKFLGIELTPSLVWNLTPWSWAADWFSNAGDVISNIESFVKDGLVMRYGYIMEHTQCIDEYTFSGETGLQDRFVRPQDFRLVSETKVRQGATPFGFGLTLSSLTTRQKAIMIALGIILVL